MSSLPDEKDSRVGTRREIRHVDPGGLVEAASILFGEGMRLALVAAHDEGASLRAVYLFVQGSPDHRVELHVPLGSEKPTIPSLAAHSFAASRFEREMRDLFGIIPIGHPQPRRLVLHQHWPEGWHPMRRGATSSPTMDEGSDGYPFAPVEGRGVYEIPVGPVHAGLIEPGHFRFWAVGESILRMKARLWYLHKGIEKIFEGKKIDEGIALAEKISGDTAVGHGLAYCLAAEEALGCAVSAEVHVLRCALLELERVYNHVSDIGALCNDVAFGFAHSRALRLRERLLRLNASVTGHRLLRGGVVLGGTRILRLPTVQEVRAIGDSFTELVAVATGNPMVMERFAGTAILPQDQASELGVVGVVARASGIAEDARIDHPVTPMGLPLCVSTRESGDVLARFQVRVDEVHTSLQMIAAAVEMVGTPARDAPVQAPVSAKGFARTFDCDPESSVSSGVGLVEGWRGVIAQRLEIDRSGRVTRAKIVDPSFMNWPALPVALADTIVPDFPLANKSFNLSYAGNDL